MSQNYYKPNQNPNYGNSNEMRYSQMQAPNLYNEIPGMPNTQDRMNEMQYLHNQNQQNMPGMNQGQGYYIPPNLITNSYNPHQVPVNTTSNNTAVSSRLIEIDTRISKYADFVNINYGMFIWSLLCFIGSIWSITSANYIEEIISNFKGEQVHINSSNYNSYNSLCFFVNLAHCIGYFYGIRSYNKQSKEEMKYSSYFFGILSVVNCLFFLVYIFFYHSGFLTFCINLIFLIFNIMLYYQSAELTQLYEEKEAMKLMYI